MITKKEQEAILRSIWRGNTTVFNLPVNLYNSTNKELKKGVKRGFGNVKKNTPDFESFTALTDNVTFFSAAKTFQFTEATSSLIFDSEGFIRPFAEFREEAALIFDTFEGEFLEVEFNMAIRQSRATALWAEILEDQEILPLLQYQTVGDDRVRDQHAAWDDIVRPATDPFWNTRMPPNDWGCRCRVIQLEKGEKRITSLRGKPQNKSKLFSNNPGKTKEVFKEKGEGQHPYFDVGKEFKTHKDNNFGLPL